MECRGCSTVVPAEEFLVSFLLHFGEIDSEVDGLNYLEEHQTVEKIERRGVVPVALGTQYFFELVLLSLTFRLI
jgi:hypothetical protein